MEASYTRPLEALPFERECDGLHGRRVIKFAVHSEPAQTRGIYINAFGWPTKIDDNIHDDIYDNIHTYDTYIHKICIYNGLPLVI